MSDQSIRADMVRSAERHVFVHAKGVSVEFEAGAFDMGLAARIADSVHAALTLLDVREVSDFVIRVDKQ